MATATETKPKPLPFHYHFLAGAIAGVSEILAMYPLDVVKTRFQLQVGKGGEGAYTSTFDAFVKIIKSEGPARLYRGILPPVMVEAPKRAVKFAANEQYSELYKNTFTNTSAQFRAMLAGMSAGMTEAFIVVSFELVKIRLQDKNSVGKYKNATEVVKQVLKTEGTYGLFRGIEATLWRNAAWNGAYFSTIQSIRNTLPKPKTKTEELRNNFFAGAIGGALGTTLNTPFDVVKSRVQLASRAEAAYNWTIPAVAKIWREEGFAALYKGYVPKVLRLGPGGGILLVVFDYVQTFIRKNFM